jgi:hypothetical protein
MESDQTFEGLTAKYNSHLYSTGQTDAEIMGEMKAAAQSKTKFVMPEMTGLRMFAIPIDKVLQQLPLVNTTKVDNAEYAYQPFKKHSQLIRKFNGIDGMMLKSLDIDAGDLDNPSEKEVEHIIPKGTPIILNKHTMKYEAI